jgi:hypothetical protein
LVPPHSLLLSSPHFVTFVFPLPLL